MRQLSYTFHTQIGSPGGLLNLSPYRIDSRANGEETPGRLKFGMGVVQGAAPGANIAVPQSGAAPAQFEGIAMTGYTSELNVSGEAELRQHATVGVLRYGSAWARIVEGVEPDYGDPLHLVVTGDDAGLFTNVSGAGTIAINGRFGKERGTAGVAAVDLYDQNV